MAITITLYDSNIARFVPMGTLGRLRVILANGATEISAGNGYSTGGKYLQNVTYNYSSGVLTIKANSISWKATGGSLSADSAYLQHVYSSATNLAKIDFGGSQTAVQNSSILINWHTNGIFRYSLL